MFSKFKESFGVSNELSDQQLVNDMNLSCAFPETVCFVPSVSVHAVRSLKNQVLAARIALKQVWADIVYLDLQLEALPIYGQVSFVIHVNHSCKRILQLIYRASDNLYKELGVHIKFDALFIESPLLGLEPLLFRCELGVGVEHCP